MFKKIRTWLYNEFLPTHVKNDLLRVLEAQEKEIAELKAERVEREAFIRGLDYALKKRVTVNINDNRTGRGEG